MHVLGTMEGFGGREDFSFKDMTTWLFTYEDELDIVGEATIDDSA